MDEQRLGLALGQWRERHGDTSLPHVWTKAGGLVRQAGDPALRVPLSAPRTPGGRTVIRDYTAEGARISCADSLARLGLQGLQGAGDATVSPPPPPPLAGLRIHDPNDHGGGGTVDDVATALRPADGMLSGLRELRTAGLIGEWFRDRIRAGSSLNHADNSSPDLILGTFRPREPRDECESNGGGHPEAAARGTGGDVRQLALGRRVEPALPGAPAAVTATSAAAAARVGDDCCCPFLAIAVAIVHRH